MTANQSTEKLLQKAEDYVARNVNRFGAQVLTQSNVVRLVADLVEALKQLKEQG